MSAEGDQSQVERDGIENRRLFAKKEGPVGSNPTPSARPSITHTVRTKDGGTVTFEGYTRGKALKLMCTECMGHQAAEVKLCTDPLCPLFPFRRGTRLAYGKSEKEE